MIVDGLSFPPQRTPAVPLFAGVVLTITGIVGCSRSPHTVPVTGVVTRGGHPVPNVVVTFLPTQGRPSFAVTDAKGRYRMVLTDSIQGVLPGTHKVTVSPPVPGGEAVPAGADGSLPPQMPTLGVPLGFSLLPEFVRHVPHGTERSSVPPTSDPITTPLQFTIDRGTSIEISLD